MPLYDYKCEKCGKIFEVEQRMTADPLTECIFCQGKVNRVFHPAGIVFKGSGFHVTDYRRDKKAKDPTPPKPKDNKTNKKETKKPQDSSK